MTAAWFQRILERYWPLFLRGAGLSLALAIVGTGLGLLIGLLVGSARTLPTPTKPLARLLQGLMNLLLGIYIEIFRSTPMMVQAMVIYYGSELFLGLSIDKLTAAFFIVSINTGAYMAEIVRGGILAVAPGQTEACKAVGMTHGQTMRLVILPQTLRNILPAVGNEFVINIKDSAVLNIISVNELFFISKSIAGANMRYFETFLITSAIYFTLTFPISRLLLRFERHLDGPDSYKLRGQEP